MHKYRGDCTQLEQERHTYNRQTATSECKEYPANVPHTPVLHHWLCLTILFQCGHIGELYFVAAERLLAAIRYALEMHKIILTRSLDVDAIFTATLSCFTLQSHDYTRYRTSVTMCIQTYRKYTCGCKKPEEFKQYEAWLHKRQM